MHGNPMRRCFECVGGMLSTLTLLLFVILCLVLILLTPYIFRGRNSASPHVLMDSHSTLVQPCIESSECSVRAHLQAPPKAKAWAQSALKSKHTDDNSSRNKKHNFTWTIYATPRDFVGQAARDQRRAIQSWTLLRPRPRIVFAGRGIGYVDVAQQFGCELDHGLDLNFLGQPLAGSLLRMAQHGTAEISAIVNSDIILTQSLPDTILHVRARLKHWLVVGARWDLDTWPAGTDVAAALTTHRMAFEAKVQAQGVLHTAGGADYFVWNTGVRLHDGPMPPFIRGKSKFDNVRAWPLSLARRLT